MEIEKNKSINDTISISNSMNTDSCKDSLFGIDIIYMLDREYLEKAATKRKRRSKNDQNGRMFKCECGKAYLSALALSNHFKSKHNTNASTTILQGEINSNKQNENLNELATQTNNISIITPITENMEDAKKKRGRPKKKNEIIYNNPEIDYKLFFKKEMRKKKQDEERIIIKEFVMENFNNNKINENPFIQLIYSENNFNFNDSNNLNTDQILLQYLQETSIITNKEYFAFIFKFILLFRDCINKYKNIELENSICVLGENIPPHIKEFTQYYDAEQLPELCNEFLTEYLDSVEYLNYSDSKNETVAEFVKIIQHFCYWLYDNNYTSSKLLLVNN
jgi:hypothetical protein